MQKVKDMMQSNVTLLPGGLEMARMLTSLDLAFQCEQIMCELQEVFLWVSIQEIGLFFGLFIVFCGAPAQMAWFWMFAPHVARGVVGIIIVFVKGLPKSHDIIDHIQISDIKNTTLESLEEDFGKGVISYLNQKGCQTKKSMLLYTMLTAVCYTFDCFSFLIMFRYYGVEGHEKAETLLMISSILYWFMSVAFFVWVARLRFRLPEKLRAGVTNMLFGWATVVMGHSSVLVEKMKGRVVRR